MNDIIPTIYFCESEDITFKYNCTYKELKMKEDLSFKPCKPRKLSTTLKIFNTTRFLHLNVFMEIYGKYKRGDKFISGLKPIQVNNEEYYFGDYNQIRPKEKSLFIINFHSSSYTTISYYHGHYPEREILYQTVYKLINQNNELISNIIKEEKYYL